MDRIIERVSGKGIRIVLPESDDRRVLEATEKVLKKGIADVTLIGNKEKILDLGKGLDISSVNIIDPLNSDLTSELQEKLYLLRMEKGMTMDEAYRLLTTDYMYYACMLVKEGYADGAVSGACHSTSNTLRPALQILKTKPGVKLVSAFFLMAVPNCCYGDNGTFIFADSGLEQNPDADKLSYIAASSAESFALLTEHEPIVAMLSHSTMGSAKHIDVDKVVEATKLAKERFPQYKIDGELQLDAAIVPSVAKSKAPNSEVAGRANVLVFPDLDAGNIGYKLVQRLANAEAYGPICQGIAMPVNDLSRGCNVDDIVGAVAITALQAIGNKREEER